MYNNFNFTFGALSYFYEKYLTRPTENNLININLIILYSTLYNFFLHYIFIVECEITTLIIIKLF